MIRKTFLGLFAITCLCLIGMTTQVEARHHHCRKSSNIQFNVGVGQRAQQPHVIRYIHTRPVILPAPVLPTYPTSYYPTSYYPPVVVYTAPTPTYVEEVVEEVYVKPAPRPFLGLGGLSFSWNFFK